MTKKIEIVVSPTGETTVTTRGFAGSSCKEASKFLEQALGQKTGERLTAEFHLPPTQQPQTLREGA